MKIVISGYYGFGNAGDEAILEAMVRDLRALAPGARLVVLSADPAATAARCGVEAVPRMHLPSVLGALRGADLFISGGGSLLQDATSWRSVPYYAGLMRLARWMGVPVFVYAQGIGPLRRSWLRRLAARALNGAAEVTVRDRLSYEMLLELGVDPAAVTITADPVFALAPGVPEPVATAAASPDPAAAGAAASGGAPAGPAASGGPAVSAGRRGDALGPQGGRLIGLCLRPVPGPDGDAATNRVLDALAAALRLRLDEWDAYVVPLPLHPAADGPVLEGLRRKLAARGAASRVVEPEDLFRAADGPPVGESRASGRVGAPTAGAVEWIHRFSRLDLCITMRLHGLILAACAGTPFVALSDDPKVAAHVDELGLPRESCLIGAEAAAAHTLGSALERAWRNRTNQVKRLHDAVPELAARARLTAVRALGRAGFPGRNGLALSN